MNSRTSHMSNSPRSQDFCAAFYMNDITISDHIYSHQTNKPSTSTKSALLLKTPSMLTMHDNQPILRPVSWRCRELVPAEVGLYRTRCETNNDWQYTNCVNCKKKRGIGAYAMARNGGCFKVGELKGIDATGKEIWDYTTTKIICP